jgi:hypothetical protein
VDHLIAVLTAWLVATSGLPTTDALPKVRHQPSQVLVSLRYGEAAEVQHQDVAGLYLDETRTIYLEENWDSRNAADVSILVHELVHHLQNVAGLTYDCPGAREKAAYEAQARWLTQFDLTLQSTFGVDDLTLKLATACFHP